jgi:DNA replication protein DnaC
MIAREQIQEYVYALYESNKNIFFIAPPGFGKTGLFMRPILDDLIKDKKNCLILSSNISVSEQIQTEVYHMIEKRGMKAFVEKNSTKFILLLNGSLIEFKTHFDQWYDWSEYKQEKTYDILFIDSMHYIAKGSSNRPSLKELLEKYDKIIATDIVDFTPSNINTELFFETIKEKEGSYQYINVQTPDDIMMEIRKAKLKKLAKR